MTVEFSGADAEVMASGADAEVMASGADMRVAVSMTANKINMSSCDQRYCTINGSGEVNSNNMRSG